MTILKLHLLGGFEAAFEGGPHLIFPSRKAQALIAVLAMTPGKLHTREKLGALLWGESGDEQARHSLRQTLVGLRRALSTEGSRLLATEADALSLDPSAVDVDALRFESLVSGSDEPSLQQAAEIYRGSFLEGFSLREEPFEEWCLSQRRRLAELAVHANRQLLEAQTAGAQPEEAIQTALRLLSLDPLQESVHVALMKLYAQTGRREAALRQYQHCTALLQHELGVEPQRETRDLYFSLLETKGPEASRGEESVPGLSRERILIVDDEPLTRTLLEGYLVGAGYEVELCRSGGEALRRIMEKAYDLLLCDVRMPEMSGLELVQALHEQGRPLPTVFITALREDDLEARGLTLGAVDFIRKPIRKDILLLRVKNALTRRTG